MLKFFLMSLIIWIVTTLSTSYAGTRFERLGIKQGLSQSTVLCFLQDQQGFLWVGTQDGLNRYDGYEFKVFRHDSDDVNSLSSDYILSLHEDVFGNIWVGTYDGGLNKYDPITEKFISFKYDKKNKNSIGENRVLAIESDSVGNLFIGTAKFGLTIYSPLTRTFNRLINDKKNPTSLSNNAISSLLKDSLGRLWVGTSGGGLNLFDQKSNRFTYYLNDEMDNQSISSNLITGLFEDRNGELWVGTETEGLNKFNTANGKFTRFKHDSDDKNSLADNIVKAITADDLGRLWIATYSGLDRYVPETKSFIHYQHNSGDPYSLSGNVIHSLLKTQDGILWIGTYGVGLNKFNLQLEQFEYFKHENNNNRSLSSSNLWAINADNSGVVWIGTDGGGLNRFDENKSEFTAYVHNTNEPDSISSNRVWAIEPTSDGFLWVGTFGKGLNRFDLETGKFTRYLNDVNDVNSLSRDTVMSLLEDSRGNLWVGTHGGISLYQKETDNFKHYKHNKNDPNSLSNNGILTIFEDSSHTLWFGTYGGGLNKFNAQTQTFTHFVYDENDQQSLSNNSVMAIIEDKQNMLWISTYGGGLNRLDLSTDKFTRFGKKQGLASSSLYGLLVDNHDKIWMSTNKGLSVLDPVTLKINNYDEKDGLQSNEFNSGAFYKNNKGELYFGGMNGLNRFNPENIERKPLDMPVIFTNMHIDNIPVSIGVVEDNDVFELEKSITKTQTLTLSYLERLFSFDFTALDFTNPERNTYAYKLEGWDKNWIKTDYKNRRATYTNIPAGTYTLKVKARGLDSDWGTMQANIVINITPAPWKTWWAYLLYFFIIITILGSFIYQRALKFRAIRQREERLSLALWASGNELWDWNVPESTMFRSNKLNTLFTEESLEHFDYNTLNKRVHKDDIEELITTFKCHVNNESDFIEATYRLKAPTGDWRWIRNRAKAVVRDNEGNAIRILGTIQDVHQLKQAQDDLRHLNDELEKRVASRTAKLTQAFQDLKKAQTQLVEAEKMASLGGLVTGIAHELNTPLGIATTAASLLEYEINELCQLKNLKKLTKSAIDRFEDVSTEGISLLTKNLNRANNLVQDFKQLAVEQSAESTQNFNIHQLLDVALNIMKEPLVSKMITTTLVCDKALTMNSYPNALTEVIQQLIKNSILHAFEQYGDYQAQININVRKNDFDVIIEYSDNGIGIDEEQLVNVFEPFYTTKRGTECTGLGMHIVYNSIVHQLSGSITCASQANKGLKITLTIPADI